jgi:ABC-type bacteriocin/lantibiotic exporter with double-glycine peptidase domain
MSNLNENDKDKKDKNNDELKSFALKVEPFIQSHGLCGPASLKILLSYFVKNYSETQLLQLSSATCDDGTEHEGMVQAIKSIGGYVFTKENGTLEELEYLVKEEKLPVIIGWFDKDGDHYSVIVNITDKNIIIVDPAVDEPERWIDKEIFPKVWFDFVGKDNRVVSWGWYMAVTFEKKKFKIKGGYYY